MHSSYHSGLAGESGSKSEMQESKNLEQKTGSGYTNQEKEKKEETEEWETEKNE
jgi:hypothetical protein